MPDYGLLHFSGARLCRVSDGTSCLALRISYVHLMFSWPPSFFRVPASKVATPRAKPEHMEVTHLGTVYSVRLRRNKAARRLILRVKADSGEAVLTLPQRTALTTARNFLDRHGGWIATRVARLPEQIHFEDGAIIPLRGEPTRIVHRKALRGRISHAAGKGGEPGTLTVACDEAHLARRVMDFLKSEAKRDLTEAVERYAAQLKVKIARMTIKDTKSRWGSCSSSGALSFSWRVILAPPYVLDYLAAHEVAHRLEMNHSVRYWRVVAGCCPHWQEAEHWLTRNGTGLHRYGPAGAHPQEH